MTEEFSSTSSSSTASSSTSANISSTTTPTIPPTSATNTVAYEAWLKQLIDNNQKPQTAAQIKATGEVKRIEGDIRNKFTVLIIIGVISVALTLFGCSIFIVNPKISKDVWVIIGPIITAGITGTVGFLTGERQGANKE